MHKFSAALAIMAGLLLSTASQAGVLYDNGPMDGTTDAWNITPPYGVANSFDLSNPSTVGGATFVLWLFPGDVINSVDWRITSDPLGGTVYGSGTALTVNTFLGNGLGYNLYNESIALGPLNLAAGTYWFELDNVDGIGGDPAYWDENNGPSEAWQYETGALANCDDHPDGGSCSETFQILSPDTVPEPGTLALFGIGLLGLGRLRRRRAS